MITWLIMPHQKEITTYHAQQGGGQGKSTTGAGNTTTTSASSEWLAQPCNTNVSTGTASASGMAANTGDRLSQMTTEECDLLWQNHRCFKCQCAFVYHTRDNCPNGSPDPCTFHTVVAADIATIKAKMSMVATVVASVGTSALNTLFALGPTSSGSAAPVATITVDSPPALPLSSILRSGSDPETDEYMHDHIISPPFLFHGILHSPSIDVASMSKLVDSGSSAVLIRDDIVTHLTLRCRKLKSPIAMNNAWDGGGGAARAVTEWVKLWVSAPTFSWSSVTCHSISLHTCTFRPPFPQKQSPHY